MTRFVSVDLTGRVFGNLTVTGQSYLLRNGKKTWLCRCTCGARALKRQDRLLDGNVKSCSMQHRYATGERRGE